MSQNETPKFEIAIDSFLLYAYIGWIEANGYKPHLVIDTTAEGVILPDYLMAQPQTVINVHSAAFPSMRVECDKVHGRTRFYGKDEFISLPIPSILAITPHGTNIAISLPGHTAAAAAALQQVQQDVAEHQAHHALDGKSDDERLEAMTQSVEKLMAGGGPKPVDATAHLDRGEVPARPRPTGRPTLSVVK